MSLNIFGTSRVAFSGLKATRGWMNIVANNIANTQTLDTGKLDASGNYVPYARQVPVFQKVLSEKFRDNKVNGDVAGGVAIKGIAELKGDVKKVYDPTHPAARAAGTADAGYVYYPDISLAQEMADLKIAAAAYEANVTVLTTTANMTQNALRIGRRM